jgi:phosphate-selective porin OprO and OprP
VNEKHKAATKTLLVLVATIAVAVAPRTAAAQKQDGPPPDPSPDQSQDATGSSAPSTLENTVEAGISEEAPRRKLVHWNEYQGPYFTIRAGAGFLVDIAGYSQDNESKQQISLSPGYKVRDFRFILGGKLFPEGQRQVTWCAGIMYDAPTNSWLIRQTGVMIAVPELWGHLFIGRAKEGFSLLKVMTGYDGWTMERQTISDATIPILADGIKWLGSTPNHRFLWNLGYFNDIFSKGQSFSSYSSQEVARLIWLPIHSEETGKLLHIAANVRYGKPTENKLQSRSRPEVFLPPYFVDTGKFQARSTFMAGYEVYYRPRNWMFGSEYWFLKADSPSTRHPVFHGGDVVASWLITKEIRTYNTVGGFFKAVSPSRPVFQGGPGAWELVSRLSYINLDGGTLRGGKFGRFTEQLNWYLSDNVRLEFNYGYGRLDRFNLKGNTHFFQSRIQLQL